MGFYKKPSGFPTLQELSGGFSNKVEQKVNPPTSQARSFNEQQSDLEEKLTILLDKSYVESQTPILG